MLDFQYPYGHYKRNLFWLEQIEVMFIHLKWVYDNDLLDVTYLDNGIRVLHELCGTLANPMGSTNAVMALEADLRMSRIAYLRPINNWGRDRSWEVIHWIENGLEHIQERIGHEDKREKRYKKK